MLVLSRKLGERIVIDADIVIEVLSIKGNQIRLGINAPSGVRILREELIGAPAKAGPTEPNLVLSGR